MMNIAIRLNCANCLRGSLRRWVFSCLATLTLLGVAFGNAVGQTARKDPLFPLVSPPPTRGDSSVFEDRYIRITFSVLKQLSFQLVNKSPSTIEVNWDQAAYVDIDGQTHRVVHRGVRFLERDRTQPVSVIPAGATLDDMAHPADYVEFTDGKWEMRDLFSIVEVVRPTSPYKTGTLKLLLPLKIGQLRKSYQFTFRLAESLRTAKQ